MLRALAFSALLALTSASVTNDTNTVCSYLYSKYPQFFAWDTQGPNAPQTSSKASVYKDINSIYWNAQNSQYRAACAFFPDNAEKVSEAVNKLNEYPSVQFALKSGGHQPAPGYSAAAGGAIISFEPNLASTVRSNDGKHFIVGVGARWGDVYNVTGRTNQIVVGGRLGHIGVAGLTLGGGLSYYSAQYGLACDNVDNFEVVLADGTIANANRTSNPDLWWALRGGGNQFAIITRITTQAHPAGINGRVWGGTRAYSVSQHTALNRAITNFVRTYPDTKAAVIPVFQFGLPGNLLNALTGPIFFFFYDGPTPPPGVFDEFDAIPSVSNNTATSDYYTVTSAGGGASLQGFGNSFRVNTVPNLPENQMTYFLDYYFTQTSLKAFNSSLTNLRIQLMGITYQPVSVVIANASQAQGGNALNLDPAHGDRIWVENDFLWTSRKCDTRCPLYSKDLSDSVLAYQKATYPGVKPTNWVSGDVEVTNYNPLFMNDAAPYQDIYSSYGDVNLARLKSIKAQYDPTGFLTTRQGGFKLPA